MNNKTPKVFTNLSKQSLGKGNIPYNDIHRDKYLKAYKFGEVLIAYDKKYGKPDKPWYLFYKKDKSYTGGFATKQEAAKWYEGKGR